MKKGKRFRVAMIVFSVLLSIILTSSVQMLAEWDRKVQEVTTLNRPQYSTPLDTEIITEQFLKLLYSFDSFDEEPFLPPEALELGYPKAIVSKGQALQDIEYLFPLLKYGYAGYQYFGGDERFLKAKEMIIEELQEEFPNRFTGFKFIDLLFKHLSFINDGHFAIGHYFFRHAHSMFMDLEYDFFRDDSGYYTEVHGVKEYIERINGQIPDPYLWPALNDEGKIVYRIGMLKPANEKVASLELVELVLRSGDSQRQDFAVLEEVNSSTKTGSNYERYSIDGIPVITVRSFPHSPEMEEFVQDAHELMHEDIMIIDLRSNRGGFGGHLGQWVEIFTNGTFSPPPFISANLNTDIVYQLGVNYWPRILEGLTEQDLKDLEKEFASVERGWSPISFHEQTGKIPNPVNIVVLMDSATASASEIFVMALRQMDNVVFLGTNTAGVAFIGNPVYSVLPNSLIGIYFGVTLQMEVGSQGFVNREGVGFLPDFWVHPEDALDVAIQFIRQYRLPN